MSDKLNDPGKTHVLDDDEIEELDELTLTSVIRDTIPEPCEDDPPDIDDLSFDILSPSG